MLFVLLCWQLIQMERKWEKYDMQVRNLEIKQEKYGKKRWETLIENKRNIVSDGKKIGEI